MFEHSQFIKCTFSLFFMPRRYRKHRYSTYRPLKSAKYSNETFGSEISIDNNSGNVGTHGSFACPVVPLPNGVLGTRKCKNFTIRFCSEPTSTDDGAGNITEDTSRVAFALVFVPEGTNPSAVQFGAGNNPLSLYEPNQNVILSGIFDSQQTYTFKTRLARNLNAGDQVVLCMSDLAEVTNLGETTHTPVYFTCNYAISF